MGPGEHPDLPPALLSGHAFPMCTFTPVCAPQVVWGHEGTWMNSGVVTNGSQE